MFKLRDENIFLAPFDSYLTDFCNLVDLFSMNHSHSIWCAHTNVHRPWGGISDLSVFLSVTFSVIIRCVRYTKVIWINGIVYQCNLCHKQSTYWVQMKVMHSLNEMQFKHSDYDLLYTSHLNFLSFKKNVEVGMS